MQLSGSHHDGGANTCSHFCLLIFPLEYFQKIGNLIDLQFYLLLTERNGGGSVMHYSGKCGTTNPQWWQAGQIVMNREGGGRVVRRGWVRYFN
jgi:hypothetical protein